MSCVCKNCGGNMYEIADVSYGVKCDTCNIAYRMVSLNKWVEDRSEVEEDDD